MLQRQLALPMWRQAAATAAISIACDAANEKLASALRFNAVDGDDDKLRECLTKLMGRGSFRRIAPAFQLLPVEDHRSPFCRFRI
jgi:hypothetical protein